MSHVTLPRPSQGLDTPQVLFSLLSLCCLMFIIRSSKVTGSSTASNTCVLITIHGLKLRMLLSKRFPVSYARSTPHTCGQRLDRGIMAPIFRARLWNPSISLQGCRCIYSYAMRVQKRVMRDLCFRRRNSQSKDADLMMGLSIFSSALCYLTGNHY